MSPPWVVFENPAFYGGDCRDGADPDIAGIGVVISFVIASIMTTTASIMAVILDQAFASKGKFSLHKPLTYIKENFVHTKWKQDYAWRPFLDPLIVSLGDQQLITGYAVLLSGWIKIAQHSLAIQGAHFALILYISALSSSSHLAALISLRKYFRKYRLIARLRIGLVIGFAILLLSSIVSAIAMPVTRNPTEGPESVVVLHKKIRTLSFIVPMILVMLGFSTALVCILVPPGGAAPSNIGCNPIYHLFRNPLVTFIVQILLAILSVILVLTQKFSNPDDPKKGCGLNEPSENTWGFGQMLSMAMLSIPVLSAFQIYLEGKYEIQEMARSHSFSRKQPRQ